MKESSFNQILLNFSGLGGFVEALRISKKMGKVGYIYWLFVQNHREEFKPFVEDNVPSDEYC